MRVLMVEDEKYMAKAVAEILKKNHYTVDLAHDGSDGLDYALSAIYDIIILDIILQMDGLTILSEIRKAGIDTPVILLTAKGQIEDKVKGLDFGADDYLTKPFSYRRAAGGFGHCTAETRTLQQWIYFFW